MVSINLKNRRTYWVFGLVVLFSLFTLWIRLVPMFLMGKTDILSMVGSDDPLYNLRQVEHLLVNFPTYQWFDPMTLYPTGTTVYWGPLFIYISAIACMISGATTRPEIIGICLLVPPVMATLVTALMYSCWESLRGLEDRTPYIGVYGNSIWPVFLSIVIRLFRSSHRGSAFFDPLLSRVYLCD